VLTPHFSEREFRCSTGASFHSREARRNIAETARRLEVLRAITQLPLRITSGYRHPTKHRIERKKKKPGAHSYGVAVDIACKGADAFRIMAAAPLAGFTGIGISQRSGQPRYIHVDWWGEFDEKAPRPMVWSY